MVHDVRPDQLLGRTEAKESRGGRVREQIPAFRVHEDPVWAEINQVSVPGLGLHQCLFHGEGPRAGRGHGGGTTAQEERQADARSGVTKPGYMHLVRQRDDQGQSKASPPAVVVFVEAGLEDTVVSDLHEQAVGEEPSGELDGAGGMLDRIGRGLRNGDLEIENAAIEQGCVGPDIMRPGPNLGQSRQIGRDAETTRMPEVPRDVGTHTSIPPSVEPFTSPRAADADRCGCPRCL